MRILNKILIIFLILLGIFFMVYSFLKSTDNLDIIQNVIGDDVENQDEHQVRMVKVYDGEIKYENLLDEFIEKGLTEKISLTINEYENKERVNHKELIFTPGINNKVIWMSLDELQTNENVDDEIKIKVKTLYEMYK